MHSTTCPVGSDAYLPAPQLSLSVAGKWTHPYQLSLRGGRFGVLEAVCRRLGVDVERLAAFNRSPAAAVRRIAADTDLPPALVRACLEAVLDGAPVARGSHCRGLARVLAASDTGWGRRQGQLRTARLIGDRDFRLWLRDVQTARDVILHRCPRTAEGRLVNDLGEVAEPGLTRAQLLAHVLRGAEHVMLSAVAEEYGHQVELRDGYLLAMSRFDARRAKRAIAVRTAYRIGVTCKLRTTLAADWRAARSAG